MTKHPDFKDYLSTSIKNSKSYYFWFQSGLFEVKIYWLFMNWYKSDQTTLLILLKKIPGPSKTKSLKSKTFKNQYRI